MLGILKLLFSGVSGKNKFDITCPVCGEQGTMHTKSGAFEGKFEVVGKTENAGLAIKECPNCKNPLGYDSLSGKVYRRQTDVV